MTAIAALPAAEKPPHRVVPRGPLLTIDAAEFAANFNEKPFKIQHRLVDHPLFELSRLIELATALPESSVEYNAGNVPVNCDPSSTPRNGLSIGETMQRIEECRSWMVLKNVEQDPAYKGVLDDLLDEVAEHSEKLSPGMCIREGYIFVTSPGSITPYHMDPEYNFLLQVRRPKFVHQFPKDDPSLVSEREREMFFAGGFRNLTLKEDDKPKALTFTLLPGEGLHFPITAPHYVQNGPEVSISFSITFRTPESNRREFLYRINNQLRKLKLNPTPVGKSKFIDGVKLFAFESARKTKKLFFGKSDDAKRDYGH